MTFARRPAAVLAAAAALLLGAGCGGDDDEEPAAQSPATSASGTTGAQDPRTTAQPGQDVRSPQVTMRDYEFLPASITVATGAQVTWANEDQAPHHAVADDGSFETETLGSGERETVTFDEPGSYPYICTIHPQMKGTVEVAG